MQVDEQKILAGSKNVPFIDTSISANSALDIDS